MLSTFENVCFIQGSPGMPNPVHCVGDSSEQHTSREQSLAWDSRVLRCTSVIGEEICVVKSHCDAGWLHVLYFYIDMESYCKNLWFF